MKKLYKIILTLVMVAVLFFTVQTPMEVLAGTISSVNATVVSSKISVSGTTSADTLACAILVYDESGTTLQAMESCGVAADNTYSYTLSQSFSAGTYIVKVADYDGGAYVTTMVTVPAVSSNSGNTGDVSDSIIYPIYSNQTENPLVESPKTADVGSGMLITCIVVSIVGFWGMRRKHSL